VLLYQPTDQGTRRNTANPCDSRTNSSAKRTIRTIADETRMMSGRFAADEVQLDITRRDRAKAGPVAPPTPCLRRKLLRGRCELRNFVAGDL
jgi:hypothetical protein